MHADQLTSNVGHSPRR